MGKAKLLGRTKFLEAISKWIESPGILNQLISGVFFYKKISALDLKFLHNNTVLKELDEITHFDLVKLKKHNI